MRHTWTPAASHTGFGLSYTELQTVCDSVSVITTSRRIVSVPMGQFLKIPRAGRRLRVVGMRQFVMLQDYNAIRGWRSCFRSDSCHNKTPDVILSGVMQLQVLSQVFVKVSPNSCTPSECVVTVTGSTLAVAPHV